MSTYNPPRVPTRAVSTASLKSWKTSGIEFVLFCLTTFAWKPVHAPLRDPLKRFGKSGTQRGQDWQSGHLTHLFILAKDVEAYTHSCLPALCIVCVPGCNCHDAMASPSKGFGKSPHHIPKPTCKQWPTSLTGHECSALCGPAVLMKELV